MNTTEVSRKPHKLLVPQNISYPHQTHSPWEKPICSIKISDMMKFYNSLLDKGLSTGYIHIMNAFLSPAFDMAVDDDLLRKNPCSGIMSKLEKTENAQKCNDSCRAEMFSKLFGKQQAVSYLSPTVHNPSRNWNANRRMSGADMERY